MTPDLDQLFAPSRPQTPEAFSTSQVWEARVVQTSARGAYVVIDSYDRKLTWGPCFPRSADVEVGQRVAVALSNLGRPWILAIGGPLG